jgi:UDP-2-acetamido-2,6-beta-L-arabino-hexul-4-ose reductase
MQLEKLDIKEDRRGLLVEAFRLPQDGQVFYVKVLPNEIRGNHYHTRKIEKFLVIDGTAEMSVKNRVTQDIMRVEVNSYKPMLITVVPNHTHCIQAGERGCIFLVWASEIFNKDDPDTIEEEI